MLCGEHRRQRLLLAQRDPMLAIAIRQAIPGDTSEKGSQLGPVRELPFTIPEALEQMCEDGLNDVLRFDLAAQLPAQPSPNDDAEIRPVG